MMPIGNKNIDFATHVGDVNSTEVCINYKIFMGVPK